MKHKTLFLLPFTLLSLSAKEKPDIGPFTPIVFSDVQMALDPIGPCEKYGDDIFLTGSIYSITGLTSVRERLSVAFKGETYAYIQTTASHDVSKDSTHNFSLTLPIHSMLGENGIDCKISLLNSSSEELKTYTFSLKPINRERINVSEYLRKQYQAIDVVVDPENYNSKHSENVIFNDFVDYFNEDNYYRLNINKLKMTYDCPKQFPGCIAKLKFTDYNNVFPYLNNDSNVAPFEIPLRWVQNGKKINFDFPEQMYVNPKTLEMSLNAKPGYRLSKYFYLPINKKDLLLDQTFSLEVSDFGHNKISFSWNITYSNNRNLLGDCNNSDYCVVGEME